MPTDEEICDVLHQFEEGHPGQRYTAACTKLRALFARNEPERMSVRLEIATRLLAALEIHPTRLGSNDIDAAFVVADALIAAAQKPRQ